MKVPFLQQRIKRVFLLYQILVTIKFLNLFFHITKRINKKKISYLKKTTPRDSLKTTCIKFYFSTTMLIFFIP